MSWPAGARAWATVACLAAAACGGPARKQDVPAAPRGAPVWLTQSALGAPLGPVQTAVIGPEGGTLTSLDGRVTLIAPPGAFAAPQTLTVQEITNTAPSPVGSAYRFGPEDVGLPEVTLVFTPGSPVSGLTLAVQNADSYWLRHRDVARDSTAETITIATSRLGDWAVVTSNTQNDLYGSFTLISTRDIPFTAVGVTTLNYGGDDAQGAHYLQWGTLTLQEPVMVGAATCTPIAATWELYANIADLNVATSRLDWGISGVWQLDCGEVNLTLLTAAFDTYGINGVGCARGWVGSPIISLSQVTGTYQVDCGARGSASVQLDLQSSP